MLFDSAPLWAVMVTTVAFVGFCLEIGVRFGRRRRLRVEGKAEVSGAMVGAAMALLTFMLAFTFNSAAGRHDARKTLVIDEANAIEKTWLRAGFLSEPQRSGVRVLLRDYVNLRVKAAAGEVDLAQAKRQSEAMQDSMWAMTLEAGRTDTNAYMVGLVAQSLNDVIDLHLKRVTVAVRNRVPPTIWAVLYLLLAVAMGMMGVQVGLSGSRHLVIGMALAISFTIVLFLIADLDRPQEGLVNVSQQAMLDLQTKLNGR
jgi:hypothetical protein